MLSLLSLIHNDITMPLLGVPLTVLATAAGGAVASFAYGAGETSRKSLFVKAIANTFIGAICVAVFPAWLHMKWMTPVLQPPAAGIIAFTARWAIPVIVQVGPEWLRRKFGSPTQEKKTPGDAP